MQEREMDEFVIGQVDYCPLTSLKYCGKILFRGTSYPAKQSPGGEKKLLVNSELIRQKRKERNLAQWQVGAVMGTDQRAISLIEKGKRRLKFEEAIRLARLFNLNVEDLIKE